MTTRISTKRARILVSLAALALLASVGCGKRDTSGAEPPAGEPTAEPAAPPPTEAAKPAEPAPRPAQPAEPPATAEPPVPAAPADPSEPPPQPAEPEPAEPVQPAQPDKPGEAEKPGKGASAPTEADKPGESASAPTTETECAAAGGTVVPSIGGKPSCPEGKKSIGNIKLGIEGALCCK